MSTLATDKQATRQLHAALNQALEREDYPQAVRLLGRGLRHDPTREDWLELLESVVRRAPDVYALVELGDRTGPEELLMLAYVQACTGHINNAVRGLFNATRKLERPGEHLAWLGRWLAAPGAARSLNIEIFVDELLRVLKHAPAQALSEQEREPLQALLPALERLLQLHGQHGRLLWVTSALARRVQRHELAVDLAEQALRHDRRWPVAMNLAYARREAGDISGAGQAFGLAASLSPENPASQIEWGVTLCQHERVAQGLEVLAQVLKREHEHPEAYPPWCYYNHHATGQESWYLDLEHHAQAHPKHVSARRYLEIMRRERPFERFMPRPEDASIWAISALVEQLDQASQAPHQAPSQASSQAPASFSLSVEALEAPSVGIALDLVCQHYAIPSYDYQVSALGPGPDRRSPLAPTKLLLWRYQGLAPSAALEPPALNARTAQIHALAMRPFHLATWWKVAGMIARELPLMEAVTTLPAMMIHIGGPVPESLWPWQWVQRVQVAAALVMARTEQGWDGTARRQALLDLARGPVDWTCGAALLALYQIAREVRGAREEILSVFIELLDALERWGWCCYGTCLCVLLMRLPEVDALTLERATRWLERQRDSGPGLPQAL